MSDQEQFVNIDDVEKHFAVSVSTVRKWLRDGLIPKATFIKIGNTYRFKLGAVEDALTRSNVDTDSPEQLELDLDQDSPIKLF